VHAETTRSQKLARRITRRRQNHKQDQCQCAYGWEGSLRLGRVARAGLQRSWVRPGIEHHVSRSEHELRWPGYSPRNGERNKSAASPIKMTPTKIINQ
jgi:hypothetical protein